MRRLSRFDILIAVMVAVVCVAASLADLPQTLGAHPWWARQTGIIGGVGGALLWLALRRVGLSLRAQLIIAALALLTSAAAAHFGKQIFVASLAENALAGRFWYVGWFALSGSVALLLAAGTVFAIRR